MDDKPKRILNALQASTYGSGGNDHRTMTKVKVVNQGYTELDDISEMVMLRRIELDRNPIGSLHGIRDNSDLEYVSASNCGITQLVVEDIINLKQLKFFNLAHNELTQIDGFPKFSSLVALLLGHNKLRRLPKLKGLKSLKTLVVSHNELDDVADVAWPGLKLLDTFSASHNRLSSLPKTFAALHELTKLRLNDNRFVTIPTVIECNAKLELVDFGRNRITSFDALNPLKALPTLQHLNLLGNPICDREDYKSTILKMFPAVKTLDSKPVTRSSLMKTHTKVQSDSNDMDVSQKDDNNEHHDDDDNDDTIEFEELIKEKPAKKANADSEPSEVKSGVVSIVVKKVTSEQSKEAIQSALTELSSRNQIGLGQGCAWDEDSEPEQETITTTLDPESGSKPPKKKRRPNKKKSVSKQKQPI